MRVWMTLASYALLRHVVGCHSTLMKRGFKCVWMTWRVISCCPWVGGVVGQHVAHRGARVLHAPAG